MIRQAVETWLCEGVAVQEIGLFVRTPQLVVRARAAITGLTGADEMLTDPMFGGGPVNQVNIRLFVETMRPAEPEPREWATITATTATTPLRTPSRC